MIIPGAGVLVMSGKKRERGELDMLHCVIFPVLLYSKVDLGGNTTSATTSTYPTSLPNIFYFFLEGALELANPLCAFSFALAFLVHFLSNTTLIPSKAPD